MTKSDKIQQASFGGNIFILIASNCYPLFARRGAENEVQLRTQAFMSLELEFRSRLSLLIACHFNLLKPRVAPL